MTGRCASRACGRTSRTWPTSSRGTPGRCGRRGMPRPAGDTARTVRAVDLKLKRYPARVEVKAASDGAAAGTFEAIVSVFGNVDYAGDRVMPGAFERTLKERGLPPIYWNHL